MINLCFITATRAEYGLLKPLMALVKESVAYNLQIIATGTHLLPEFGNTYTFIEKDGFVITEKLDMLMASDSELGIAKSMGLGMIGCAEIFDRLKPDAIVILGDRYEMLAFASAANIFRIPIVHLHGGEITEGAYDDSFRHAITKLSYLHFASTEEYRNRIIQMGEEPDRVFNVGAIGIDNINSLAFLSKSELEQELGIQFKTYNYQVTFHPETLANLSSEKQFQVLLEAIDQLEDSFFVFTKANADTDGKIINLLIDKYVQENPSKAKVFASLGSLRFLSLLKVCDAIVGNSSSGIIEAPSLKVATINIGDRQKGRIQANSVVNVDTSTNEILDAIELIKTEKFRSLLSNSTNPYGQGNTSEKIMGILATIEIKKGLTKSFFNRSGFESNK